MTFETVLTTVSKIKLAIVSTLIGASIATLTGYICYKVGSLIAYLSDVNNVPKFAEFFVGAAALVILGGVGVVCWLIGSAVLEVSRKFMPKKTNNVS